MSEILDFWANKHNYPKEILNEKMIEFYRADFIENYSKWKSNIDDLNETALQELNKINFPNKYWKQMTYDIFCKKWIDIMSEWIKVNNDIDNHDIKVIYQKLFEEFIADQLHEWDKNMYNIENLLESVKKSMIIKNA